MQMRGGEDGEDPIPLLFSQEILGCLEGINQPVLQVDGNEFL